MSVAAFIVHFDDPFKSKELALLYLAGYLIIFVIGPGKYSIDKR
jgi:putative oxidoreductase